MKKTLTSILAAPLLALTFLAPAAAQTAISPACSGADVSSSGSFLTCAGYFQGNLNSGSLSTKVQVASILNGLGLSGGTLTLDNPTISISRGNTIDFGQALTGVVAFGIHVGNADPRNGTAFYVFDASALAPGTTSILFNAAISNGSGGTLSLSNAELYGTNLVYTPVPEPGTWALMLSGLGVMGHLARRRRAAGR